jgi:hypothetical protein
MSVQRHLDGYYFRILHEGKYQAICFSDMNDAERETVVSKMTKSELQNLAKGLGSRLYQIGQGYNIKL